MSKYDNVVIFGVEQMMEQLEEKLEQELKEGSTVVACRSHPCVTPRAGTLYQSTSWIWFAGSSFLHGSLLMKLAMELIQFGDTKGSEFRP